MALGIPAMAWIENSALLFVLIAAGILGIVAVFWWHSRERRVRSHVER
jgi:sensor domain CHASE-containing protein